MNKAELITFIASEHCVTKYEAKRSIDIVIDSIIKVLGDGQSVELAGFGSFRIKHREAREGLHPQTREKISIAAFNTPRFKAGSKFKDACNK